MKNFLNTLKHHWPFIVGGAIIGALIVLVIRFATYQLPDQTHYHANFAVFLNGQRFTFKDPKYYQEVSICSASTKLTTPLQRTHMHDEENSVVHVHDHVVTWGQFFNNLGWYIGPDFIETDDGTMYRASGDDKLHIVINGQDYTDLQAVTNMVIGDQSKLLVSFGNVSDKTLKQEYDTIQNKAKHADETADPSSCSGNEAVTVSDRLHHLF